MTDHEIKIYDAGKVLQVALVVAGLRFEKRSSGIYVDLGKGLYAKLDIVTISPKRNPTFRQIVCKINKRSAKVETPAFPDNVIKSLRKIAATK